jgi:hypothetical protein
VWAVGMMVVEGMVVCDGYDGSGYGMCVMDMMEVDMVCV